MVCLAGSRGRGRKGISTIVAIAIFFMLFATALSAVYTWQVMTTEYTEVGAQQMALDRLRVAETLEVYIVNSNELLLTNPTAQTVRVLHVLSDDQLVWSGSFDVKPFSSDVLYHSKSGGSTYRVVTMRGNVFSAGLEDQRAALTEGAWHVTFRMNNTVPSTPFAWNESSVVAETYWYNTNLNWEWNSSSQILGNLSVPAGTCVGFVATTTLVKTVDEPYNATINYLIDTGDASYDRSRVAFYIDGILLRPLPAVSWYDSSHYVSFTLQGVKYSLHEVSVLFYGRDVDVQKLSLNIVNATFTP